MTSNDEVPGLSATAGRNLQAWRRERGLSRERLATVMTDLGVPVTAAVVTNLELGRKRPMSVEEAAAAALALGVRLIDLLAPPETGPDEPVALTPATQMPGHYARRWLAGDPTYTRDPHEYLRKAPASVRLAAEVAQHPAGKALQVLEVYLRAAILRERAVYEGYSYDRGRLPRLLRSAAETVSGYADALAYEVEQRTAEEEERDGQHHEAP